MINVLLEVHRTKLSLRDLLHVLILFGKEQQCPYRCTCTYQSENTRQQRTKATPRSIRVRNIAKVVCVQVKDDSSKEDQWNPEQPADLLKAHRGNPSKGLVMALYQPARTQNYKRTAKIRLYIPSLRKLNLGKAFGE